MRYLILLPFLLPAVSGSAQNLVQNGSFEEFDTCPSYHSLAHFALGWSNLYTGSADYFNSCNENGIVDVPLSGAGFQYAYHGEGYLGVATYSFNQPQYREIIGVELTEPLQPGVPVCLSFKVAVGGFGTNNTLSTPKFTCKGIGMNFFTEFPADWNSYLYPNSAALYLDVVPVDTAIWYELSGQYIPDSAYSFLALGNFFADSLSEVTLLDSVSPFSFTWAYSFIDDVRVSYDPAYCMGSQGMNEPLTTQAPMVFPVPFSERLLVHWKGKGAVRAQLFDVLGHVVVHAVGSNDGELEIVSSDLRDGAYLLKLYAADGSMASRTVVRVSP